MAETKCEIRLGDCAEVLREYPDTFFDLIVTSPPYADSRARIYGGIKSSQYVDSFWHDQRNFSVLSHRAALSFRTSTSNPSAQRMADISYEKRMLQQLAMPTRIEVGRALLRTLLKNGGVVKEFGAGQDMVDQLADEFHLNKAQRSAALETVYRKENRLKKALLWHRLLFRAADSLANEGFVSRPTQTVQLTNKREWMLTEKGFDEALRISNIRSSQKDSLPIKSYEVQKVVKKLVETQRPTNYQPFNRNQKTVRTVRETALRVRGFRQAVIEVYDFRCAVCGLKINSLDSLCWEVEAAHIVPHGSFGRDDLFNGVALCRFHHWAFDVGWFALLDNYRICVSSKLSDLPLDFGRVGENELIRVLAKSSTGIRLPSRRELYPHINSLRWHRQFIFHA